MKFLRIIISAVIVIAALAYINIVLLPQPKQTSAHTDSYNFTDSCGVHALSAQMTSETCSDYFHAGNDYNSNITVTNTSGHTLENVVLHVKTFYCENATELDPGNPSAGINPGSCLKREKDYQTDAINLAAGKTHTFPNDKIPTRSPSEYNQNMCGLYQYDFWFSYKNGGNTCTSTWNGKDFGFAGDSYCKLWDGHTLKSSNPWSPEWECGNTHQTCQNNACVTVGGKGTSTCSSNSDCKPQPQYHNVCQSFACVKVAGPGQNQCGTVTSGISPECSHLTCLNNLCERAPGPGQNTCTGEGSSCGQIQHMACQDNACRLVPGPGRNTCSSDAQCQPPTLNVIKIVNNNHGGTKQAGDFSIHVKDSSGNDVNGSPKPGTPNGTPYSLAAGDYTVSEDSVDGYHQVSISGACDSNGHVHLTTGTSTCVIENEDNGTNACTMPTCNTNIAGCSYPYPDTTTCSCGPMVCITQTPGQNITINNNVSQSQQQQQQQEVLGASVAPASTATSLPSTGAGAEVLLSLFGLLPLGWKLRKLV